MTISIEQLSAYYDGELAVEEQRSVEDHLTSCPDCQGAVRQWERSSLVVAAGASSRVEIRRTRGLVLASILALLVFGTGVAMASGLFNEVFRIGDLSAVGSRLVTLEGARVANLPLPRSQELPGGWRVDQVQLVITPTWRSVDVQYRRPGAAGIGVTAYSQDINVNPSAQRREVVTVSGIPVELGYSGESATARFTHQGSTVIVRYFTSEVDANEIRGLVQAWIEQAK
jgi:hypothetical protein